MDSVLDVATLCAAVTFIVEILKAWVPAKFKDSQGLVFQRKGKKALHLPSQAVWPVVSGAVGAGLFLLLSFDPLGFGSMASQALGGVAAGTAGGAAVFRVKNTVGSKLGGTDSTNAQATGPSVGPSTDDTV